MVPSAHHREFTELPITLDRSSGQPLSEQIAAALREAINAQTLRADEPVPASREFAARLKVARGVVVAAYSQLITEGYLTAQHGRGTRVHPELSPMHLGAPTTHNPIEKGTSPEISDDQQLKPLAPGSPDTFDVNTPAWRSAWRSALNRAHLEAPFLGDLRLREQIAEHLRRMRATQRNVSDVIVTAGARDALSLLLVTLSGSLKRKPVVGVEDPGYASLRSVAEAHGSPIVPLAVDEHGIVTHSLPERGLDLIIITPSHQYPLGASLPLSRRRELLDWALRTGAVIVEDDYDSELRHSGSPLPALAALDDAHDGSVVLLGSFSKTVTPALAAGFLLAPARLREQIEPVRQKLGGQVSAVVQAALAEYLASGEHRRHVAKMRRRYARRRELVVEHLYGPPGVRVLPMSGGLHAVVELIGAGGATEQRLTKATSHLGAVALSTYWQGTPNAFGLVVGTGGNATEAEFVAALKELKHLLNDLS